METIWQILGEETVNRTNPMSLLLATASTRRVTRLMPLRKPLKGRTTGIPASGDPCPHRHKIGENGLNVAQNLMI